MSNEIIQTGLEIGSSHVKCVISSIVADKIKIKGYASRRCNGIEKGNIIDINDTVETIREVVGQAEERAKVNINFLNLGVHGLHITGKNNHAAVAILSHDQEINTSDVKQVLNSARAVLTNQEQQIIHTVPQEYIVDHQKGVRDPRGMSANHLHVNVYNIIAVTSILTNVKKCVEKAGFEIQNTIFSPLAAANTVLLDEEKKLGCLLIDIGGKLSEISYYERGALKGVQMIVSGGDYITDDLAKCMKISRAEGSRIKKDYGFATQAHIPTEGKIEITKIDGRTKSEVSVKEIAKIISERLKDILKGSEGISECIKNMQIEPELITSCIITGGGAKLPGIDEYIQSQFNFQTRLGYVQKQDAIGDEEVMDDLSYTSAIGLTKYDVTDEMPSIAGGKRRKRRSGLIEWIKRIF